MNPLEKVERILAAGDGAVRRSDLLAAGVSRDWVTRNVRTGTVREIFPGVVAAAVHAEDWQTRLHAALLFGGEGSRLSHVTAAAALGLRAPRVEPIHIAIPHGRRRRVPEGLVLHQRVRGDDVRAGRYPVVPAVQTLADLLECLPLDDVRAVTAQAVRTGLVSRDQLSSDVRTPRRDARTWRRIVEEIRAGALSAPEACFWRAVVESGLPRPRLNAVVIEGGQRWAVDALWPEYRLGVEIDGYEFHGGPVAFQADRSRQNGLHVAGIMIIRFAASQVLADPVSCVTVARSALRARAEELRLSRRLRDRLR